jgi:hypothetical protein
LGGIKLKQIALVFEQVACTTAYCSIT